MSPLTVIIVDDEALARNRLRGMLLQASPEVEIVGECADGASALAAIREKRPDLVFLDMEMPGGNGLEVIAQMPLGRRPAIVFATAHERFAIEAFNVAAADYLLKPFDRERLQLALDRVCEQVGRRPDDAVTSEVLPASPPGSRSPERLAFKSDGRIVFLRPGEIIWVEADDNYVTLHLATGRLLLRETLAAIERRLGGQRFARINRSALVQLDQIRELQPALHGDYHVVLRDGTKLSLSRSLRGQFDRFAGGSGQ